MYVVQMATQTRLSGYRWADVSKPVGSLRLAQTIRDGLKSANPNRLYRTARIEK